MKQYRVYVDTVRRDVVEVVAKDVDKAQDIALKHIATINKDALMAHHEVDSIVTVIEGGLKADVCKAFKM